MSYKLKLFCVLNSMDEWIDKNSKFESANYKRIKTLSLKRFISDLRKEYLDGYKTEEGVLRMKKSELRKILTTAYTHGKNNLSNGLWAKEYLPEMLNEVNKK